jgi:hypothetical protein
VLWQHGPSIALLAAVVWLLPSLRRGGSGRPRSDRAGLATSAVRPIASPRSPPVSGDNALLRVILALAWWRSRSVS